jgi:uncharacterized protein
MPLIDSTDAELDAFDAVCRRLAGFNPRVAAEWADGYLTALAAGPRAVLLDEAVVRMVGDDFERTFADPDDAAQARQALGARMKVLGQHLDPQALLDDPESLRLQPLVSLWDEAAREDLVRNQGVSAADAAAMTTGGLWAEGFFDAIEDFADDWQHPAWTSDEARQAYDEILSQVSVLCLADADDDFKAHLERHWKDRLVTREDLIDEACFAVQDLRAWWLDHAPRPPTRRVPAQPGRNDPCPCGSGRKFKKCHGQTA